MSGAEKKTSADLLKPQTAEPLQVSVALKQGLQEVAVQDVPRMGVLTSTTDNLQPGEGVRSKSTLHEPTKKSLGGIGSKLSDSKQSLEAIGTPSTGFRVRDEQSSFKTVSTDKSTLNEDHMRGEARPNPYQNDTDGNPQQPKPKKTSRKYGKRKSRELSQNVSSTSIAGQAQVEAPTQDLPGISFTSEGNKNSEVVSIAPVSSNVLKTKSELGLAGNTTADNSTNQKGKGRGKSAGRNPSTGTIKRKKQQQHRPNMSDSMITQTAQTPMLGKTNSEMSFASATSDRMPPADSGDVRKLFRQPSFGVANSFSTEKSSALTQSADVSFSAKTDAVDNITQPIKKNKKASRNYNSKQQHGAASNETSNPQRMSEAPNSKKPDNDSARKSDLQIPTIESSFHAGGRSMAVKNVESTKTKPPASVKKEVQSTSVPKHPEQWPALAPAKSPSSTIADGKPPSVPLTLPLTYRKACDNVKGRTS